jgi:hypothetical protein
MAALCFMPHAAGQDASPFDDLPDIRNLAASIADPDSRSDALMTMLAVVRLQQHIPHLQADNLEAVRALFIEDHAWLDELASRYVSVPSHSSIFDPPAWLIVRELEQHDLVPISLVTPLGPGFETIIEQLFDRSDPGIAAAMLPEALFLIESRSIPVWQALLADAGANANVLALISGLNADWFDAWMAAESPSPSGDDSDPLNRALESLLVIAGSMVRAGPPDALRLKRLRFELLLATGSYGERQIMEAARLLRLATVVDGLHDSNYMAFSEALMWSVSDLLNHAEVAEPAVLADPEQPLPEAGSQDGEETGEVGPDGMVPEDPLVASETTGSQNGIALAAALAELLPRLSNTYARQFADVEPRINSILAAAFDVVQMIQSGAMSPEKKIELSDELADAVTQIILLMPDLDYYTEQPIRRLLSEEIDICISIAANRDANGDYTLSREQFDACQKSMVDLAESRAREAELAGDPDGPFGMDQLRRELPLAASQRINYTLGYTTQVLSPTCQIDETLPNPLEWSVLATLMAWLAERSPVYFQTPENEAQIVKMRRMGSDLQQALARQADCLSGTGSGPSDPVSRSLAVYRTSLLALVGGIREAELAFRNEHLKDGADVVLTGDASQHTGYRMEELRIGPCDPENICEMSEEVEATRALVGLFPDEYLIAEQTGLGELEICYDNMAWVDRRSSSLRNDDANVADYHGRLSFELYGRYRENDRVEKVFGSRFVSPDEYHYMFAAATQEILDDECPVEWVGSRVVTTMESKTGFRVVPRRLTYLASARSKPSQVISANWSKGSQWRDWFVTGIGVESIELEAGTGIADRVNQHLRDLYQMEQAGLYQALLEPPMQRTRDDAVDLNGMLLELATYKALIRNMLMLFYPDTYVNSDAVRAAMEGTAGLLDTSVLQRFRNGNLAVGTISDIGIARADRFQGEWDLLPDTVRRSGTVAAPVAYAMMRLNTIYKRFFALPEPASQTLEGVVPQALPETDSNLGDDRQE